MELRALLGVLKRRMWIVLITAGVTLAVVALGTNRMTPIYSTTAVARVAGGYSGTVNYSDLNYSQRLRETYAFLLKSRPFLQEVVSRLDPALSVAELAPSIKVESLPDTELIRITVENRDPQLAADIANTLTKLLVDQGQKVYSGEGKSAVDILQEQLRDLEARLKEDRARLASLSGASAGSLGAANESTVELSARIQVGEQTYSTLLSQYEKARTDAALRANSISVAEPAIAPETPSKPNVYLYLVLGALVGLAGGLGLALLFENLDPTIHASDNLQMAVSMPLLGRIPRFRTWRRNKRREVLLWGAPRPQLAAIDAFRVLGVNTLAGVGGEGSRSLLIGSAESGAGKSVVAANLAGAIAATGRRVILVDGDQRRPCQHDLFGLERAPGVRDVILEPGTVDRALQPTPVASLWLLAAGSSSYGHDEAYTSDAIAVLLEQLKARAEFVIWDSPPILLTADAVVIASQVDGVLLVAARDHTSGKQLDLAIDALANVGVRPVGTVFNLADDEGAGGRYYYYRASQTERSARISPNGHTPESSLEPEYQPHSSTYRRKA